MPKHKHPGDGEAISSNYVMRRQGGKRQRLSRAAAENPVAACILESCLAVELCLKFAWGVYTPQTVQHLASCACKDMDQLLSKYTAKYDLGDIRKLSELGSGGKHVNNCHRDLMKMIDGNPALPRPKEIHVPIKGYVNLQSSYMFLPHELFAEIHSSYYFAFKKIFCPSAEKCAEFWKSARDHPAMANHPIKQESGWESMCIPISLHGDGTPITGRGKSWCKNMVIWSMSSLLVSGSTKTSQIYVYSLFDKLIKTGAAGTVEKAMEILMWSFYHLYLGVWPSSPHDSDVKKLFCISTTFCMYVDSFTVISQMLLLVCFFLYTGMQLAQ